jgi:hypothetical protein
MAPFPIAAGEPWPRQIVAGVMAPMDDIKGGTTASEAAGSPTQARRRSVGRESATRAGPEAPGVPLSGGVGNGGVSQPERMPGQRADLPAGSLPGPYLGPQGDENRAPPSNAPSPVKPAVTVATPVADRKDYRQE